MHNQIAHFRTKLWYDLVTRIVWNLPYRSSNWTLCTLFRIIRIQIYTRNVLTTPVDHLQRKCFDYTSTIFVMLSLFTFCKLTLSSNLWTMPSNPVTWTLAEASCKEIPFRIYSVIYWMMTQVNNVYVVSSYIMSLHHY